MKIEKAIEVQTDMISKQQGRGLTYHENDNKRIDALKLGIEALKAVEKMRHYPFPDEILHLPGETKE